MKTGFVLFMSLILSIQFPGISYSQEPNPDYLKPYNKSIFLILDYSDNSSDSLKKFAFTDLLKKDFDGCRVFISLDNSGKQVMLKNPDGSYSPFSDALISINHSLRADTGKIFTIFLDPDSGNMDVTVLKEAFQQSGLSQFLYEHKANYDWPSCKSLVDSNRRLVVFALQKYESPPLWLHYLWDYVVQPKLPLSEGLYSNENFNGKPENDLFIFNEFVSSGFDENNQTLDYSINRMKLITDNWIRFGKMTNYIMINHYRERFFLYLKRILKNLKTVSGKITYNGEFIDNISWTGLNSYTTGKYCFPVLPDEKLIISPVRPGYSFTPQSIKIDDPSEDLTVNFEAKRLKITQNLEASFIFDNDARNLAVAGANGITQNVEFGNDPVRGTVSLFKENSMIIIPDASSFKLKDNSFTVSCWLKIPVYLPYKQDYCIIGSKTGSYLKGLHILIRDKRPYIGFWGADLPGNTVIDPGQWYHLVFRYNLTNREQAIFVNGKLDAHGSGRSPYKGNDSLYLGISPASGVNNHMVGEMDDLSIWSRALGEEEIAGLSSQLVSINSPVIFIRKSPLLLISVSVLLILLLLFLVYLVIKYILNRRHNNSPGHILKGDSYVKETKPVSNSIKLFGDFEVFDRNGNNISKKFTPKLKQLFLILMLHSQEDNSGISGNDLSEMLWKDYSNAKRSNIRRVNILKLRTIINSIDDIKIENKSGDLIMIFSGRVYCDYLECIKMLRGSQMHDHRFYNEFYNTVSAGEIFKGESFVWLDDYKGYISNGVVDILQNYAETLSLASDSELILKISELILINDHLNEEAISFKIKALIKQNNNKSAQYTFERFCSLYNETYGEKFKKTFDQIIS